MASLPLKLAIFFFIPYLPAIDQILPYYIGTRCYGGKRIQEGEGEPDAHYRILLSQRLTGTDTRTEMPAYRLADGKLEETYQQRYKEQQKHRYARYLGMEHVANRFAHQYREVETPHIKAQILYILHFIHPFWQEPAAQQGKQQRHHQHGSDIAEHHRTHHEERDICPLLYHREKTRDDDHRKDVGDDRIGGERTDTAAQLLGNHSYSGWPAVGQMKQMKAPSRISLVL